MSHYVGRTFFAFLKSDNYRDYLGTGIADYSGAGFRAAMFLRLFKIKVDLVTNSGWPSLHDAASVEPVR